MIKKTDKYMNELAEFQLCINDQSWYTIGIEEVLEDLYDGATLWNDTLDFMDLLIENFEKTSSDDIVIKAEFWLGDSPELNLVPPTQKEFSRKCLGSTIIAFPQRIAALISRCETYQCPLWNHDPRCHSAKLYTCYRCSKTADTVHQEVIAPYRQVVVRFYSQKGTMGNSPGFLTI